MKSSVRNLATFYINHEERDQFLAVLREKGEVKGYEAPLRAKDGSMVFVSTNAQFYRDKAGEILGIQGMTRDFTERKLMEKTCGKAKRNTGVWWKTSVMSSMNWTIRVWLFISVR